MATIKVPARLPELAKAAFSKALADGDLFYFPTQVQDMRVGSLSFQLRFSPSLANKPKGASKSSATTPSKPFDPFEYTTPPPPLFVGDVGPAHFLVLNKFAIVPGHLILATRAYRAQTHILEADDLHATLACLRAFEEHEAAPAESGALFAFFNGGEHSGASQPHRHIQLLPVAAMREGLPAGSPWSMLASRLDDAAVAPFRTFAEKIRLDMPRGELHAAYLRLYEQSVRAAAGDEMVGEAATTGEAAISYNLAMTRDRLVLCPRRAEGADITDEDGKVVGQLALNGTMLAGTALVKTEAEWDALRGNPAALTAALKMVGVAQPRFVDTTGNKL
ncbi:Histidine triad-like motif protein [Cordyceps fumosorosea ARSEF 2679]|uniref:Histidine triad-like motif protein n=1 Tax=Cordyceps fumosorosea (strain ARSEF 2679) TaxID=1081104 RepID=A0A167P9J9_CORFA|nr:Histidine triad-like motif protein [Cordyceps fumosorosea ARSEF 2679]OAA56429.1 Histidine triad-like motif protein [Cordyceps fumosorosea ARSEF 2679]